MQYGGYSYGGYPAPGGYYPPPPVPDQLAQLRQQQQYQNFQPNMMQGNQMQNNMGMQQMNPPIAQQQQQNQNTTSILWVSSEREATEYPVAPNTAVALWDSNAPVVYIRKADASGKPDTEIYELVRRNPAQAAQMPVQSAQVPQVEYVTREEWQALKGNYDALAAELEELKAKRTPQRKQAKGDDE